jgi:hypothetical protein
MADEVVLESRLRKKLLRLLRSPQQSWAASIVNKWEERGWGPILFGGLIRDLMVFGIRRYPRDVDVVLSNATTDQLLNEDSFQDFKLNRFGGVHVNINRWSFDVWPLDKTWRFTVDDSLIATPANLPRTTFLDVEAIAVTLNGPHRIGRIYSVGFFQAIKKQCIDINYEENPFPSLCAVRSIIIAWKLNYRLSRKLACYFVDVVAEQGAPELVFAQDRHYQKVLLRESDISDLKNYFEQACDSVDQDQITLPNKYDPKQLEFWPD